MKKITALALALCLLLACSAAFAATPGEVVGTWYCQSMTDTSFEFGAGVPTGDYRLELNRDGTALLVCDGQERNYAWEVTEKGVDLKPVSEYEATYQNYWYYSMTLNEDGTLTIGSVQDFSSEEGHYYDFTMGREAVDTSLPAKVAAEKEDDFYGEWIAAVIAQDGFLFDVSAMNFHAKVEFAQVTFTAGDSEPVVVMTEFKDGMLTCDGRAFDYRADKATFELAEMKGTVCATFTGEGEEIYTVYLVNPETFGTDAE